MGKRLFLLFISLLFISASLLAQVQRESVEIFFRQGRAVWEPSYQEMYKRQLMTLHQGVSWNYMNEQFFSQLRRFRIDVYIGNRAPEEWEVERREKKKSFEPLSSPQIYEVPQTLYPIPQSVTELPVNEVETIELEVSTRALYLKSNAVAWAMFIANLGVEYQFSEQWSVTLPIYFSTANYFTRTLKFRTLCFQPEVRYWLPQLKGLFAGAHFSLAWYNYANGGAFRYQDHGRHTPLYGGGVSVGYRKPFGRNDKWHVEFSFGAGVCPLHYDIFRNEPNGKLLSSKKRTFVGVDHVGVTFSYRFDLKGGKR